MESNRLARLGEILASGGLALLFPPSHRYVSTACVHRLHDRCRRRCKFCPARCLCSCHRTL